MDIRPTHATLAAIVSNVDVRTLTPTPLPT